LCLFLIFLYLVKAVVLLYGVNGLRVLPFFYLFHSSRCILTQQLSVLNILNLQRRLRHNSLGADILIIAYVTRTDRMQHLWSVQCMIVLVMSKLFLVVTTLICFRLFCDVRRYLPNTS